MKRRFLTLFCIVAILLNFVVIAVMYKQNNIIENTINISSLEDVNIIDLYPKQYIELPDLTLENYGFTATGISYDYNNNCYYVGNYGKSRKEDKEIHPSILSFHSKFQFISNELFFGDNSIDVQGISYDENESIWYTNSDSVINCSAMDGKEISSFKIEGFEKYKANGVCVDPQDGSLWVLCMYKYLLHYERSGQLIRVFDCDYIGQDHIYIDNDGHIFISAGIDYSGNENYVLRFNKEFSLEIIYRVNESYAIEGIYVNDSELIVVNDGIYHNAKIDKNYIQKYSLITEE